MKKSMTLLFAIALSVQYALSQDKLPSERPERQSEFVQLMVERSEILASLDQNPSPEMAKSLRARLSKIQRRLRNLGIDIPAPPTPLMGEVDRTDLPIPRPATPSTEGKRYRLDFSVSPSFSDNYFQAVAGTPTQSAWLTTLSSSLQLAVVRRGRNQLTLGLDMQRNHVEGIQNADWNSYGARLSYSTRNSQLTFQGIYGPRRLTFITRDGNPGRGTTSAVGSDYSRKLTGRLRVRLFYRWNEVRYPGFVNRDLFSQVAAGDFQYHFHSLFVPGVGFEWTDAQADLASYSHTERTPVLLLGTRFGRVASVNLRYRYRERIYPTSDINSSNYGRKDRRHDAYMYLNFNIGRHIGFTLYGSYLQNISARADREFKALNGGVSLKCLFPGN